MSIHTDGEVLTPTLLQTQKPTGKSRANTTAASISHSTVMRPNEWLITASANSIKHLLQRKNKSTASLFSQMIHHPSGDFCLFLFLFTNGKANLVTKFKNTEFQDLIQKLAKHDQHEPPFMEGFSKSFSFQMFIFKKLLLSDHC